MDNEKRCEEPLPQWHMRTFHDGACCDRDLFSASRALISGATLDMRTVHVPASWTHETVRVTLLEEEVLAVPVRLELVIKSIQRSDFALVLFLDLPLAQACHGDLHPTNCLYGGSIAGALDKNQLLWLMWRFKFLYSLSLEKDLSIHYSLSLKTEL